MRTLLIGLLVGGISGWALQKYALTGDTEARRQKRTQGNDAEVIVDRTVKQGPDVDALLERIKELEALLANQPGEPDLFAGVEVPTTDEGIELLFEEWNATDDLDKLLALIRALLLQGERGYPRLTKVVLRLAGKVAAGKINETEALQRIVPGLKLALRHEKELVGYVGYLLTADNIPGMMRTGAMGAAMFLSINRVQGSEGFAPLLLEAFTKAGAGMGRNQARMLVEAMGILRQKEAVDPLLAILNDPQQQNLHHRAVDALGNIGDPRAVGPLVERLRSPDRESQWWAPELRALGRIGTPEATAAAEEFIASVQNDDQFFNHAGNYLNTRNSAKVTAMVRERFRKNPATGNLWWAMRGLNRANTPESNALLEEIAASATQEHTKRQARNYLDERKKLNESLQEAER